MEKENNSKIFLIAIIAIVVIVLISNNFSDLTGSSVTTSDSNTIYTIYQGNSKNIEVGENTYNIAVKVVSSSSRALLNIDGIQHEVTTGINQIGNIQIDVKLISPKISKKAAFVKFSVGEVEWSAEKSADTNIKYEEGVFTVRVMRGKGTLKTSYSGSTWECFLSRDNKGELKIDDEILYSTASLPYNMVYLQECNQIGQTNGKKLENAACVFVSASQSCTGKNEFYLLSIFDKDVSLMPQNAIGKSGYPIIKETYINLEDGTISKIHPATQYIYFMPK